jgi:hypothetical protein
MRVLSAITDPHVARRILECLKLAPRAPPLTPAREREPELDNAPDFGPSSGSIDEVEPGFEFDQSVPENDCP